MTKNTASGYRTMTLGQLKYGICVESSKLAKASVTATVSFVGIIAKKYFSSVNTA